METLQKLAMLYKIAIKRCKTIEEMLHVIEIFAEAWYFECWELDDVREKIWRQTALIS